MSEKAGTGCLSTIIVLGVLGFIGRYVPLQYVLVVGLLIWGLERYVNREKYKLKRDEEIKAASASATAARLAAEENERKRISLRDADYQETPYLYSCIGHPNVTLAIRYGIANLKREVKEYWYYGKGGVQQRNPDRDKITYKPADAIRVRKLKRIQKDHYLGELPDFGNRTVRVVIEPGTEAIKTFYPMHEAWFDEHADLERALKDNKTFTLKEMALLHVQKTVKSL